MKRQILLTAVIMSLCGTAAYAAQPQAEVNYAEGIMTVSGTAAAEGDVVTINILKPGYTADNISGSEAIVYSNDTVCDEQGSYSFTVKMPASAPDGEYTVYLGSKSFSSAEVVKIGYMGSEDYTAAVRTLNNAASAGESAFKAELDKYKTLMGFTGLAEADADADRAAAIFCNSVKTAPLSESDSAANVKLYKSALICEALNESKLKTLSERIDDVTLANADTAAFYKDIILKGNGNELFMSQISGKGYTSVSELEAGMETAMILSVVRYPDGVGNIEKVFKAYSNIGANTAAARTQNYQAIAGKSYSTVAQCVNAFNASVASNSSASGGGSSSGGGGGGSSSSGSSGGNKGTISAPASAGTAGGTVGTTPELGIRFEDLNPVPWAYTAISKLYEKGVISGRSDTVFAPNDNVTREEFVKMLVGAFGLEPNGDPAEYFDVPKDAWYKTYVDIADSNGVCSGIGNGLFGTGMNITREDMAVMLYNVLNRAGELTGGRALDFVDEADFSEYSKPAVAALGAKGIVSGMGDGTFAPKGFATRAEAAVIINNALEK